jgi:RHS repeat-associated protein
LNHYNKDGRTLSETDSNGNLIADNIYLNGKLVAKAESSALYFYHTDPAGTPLAMTDVNKVVVWKSDYKPFGEEDSITGTIENNEKFAGKEKDKETGLYYFGARYLGPKTGRFVTVDPAGISEKDLLNPQRLNRYAYSLNNPYRYVDPDGRVVWDLIDFAFFAHSAYKFVKEPSWSNAGDLGLDAVGLLPIVPSLGVIKAVGKGVDKAIDASKAGKTVLGHKPEYVTLADEIGARRFNIPTEVWEKMGDAERWAANQKFLDRMINRGDEIILATPGDKARRGSFFHREMEYLKNKGYKLSEDKMKLIPGN